MNLVKFNGKICVYGISPNNSMELDWTDVTSVILGASRKGQILENVKLLKNTSFTQDERNRIDEILKYNFTRKLKECIQLGQNT